MIPEILSFDELGDPNDPENRKWRQRYEEFSDQILSIIAQSRNPRRGYMLGNINTLRGILSPRYNVRLLNNGQSLISSMEELYGRVRIESLRVIVIDAVGGLIEISETI